MEHLYIEKNNKRLYSVYQEPVISVNNQIGIVLCYPLGQEYIRCHKLFVNLAKKVALKGFHVLRFDYSGTGDSINVNGSLKMAEWINDIDLAISELTEIGDITKIILIGVRFGATLSLLYAENFNVDSLVLWSPIFDGKEYLDEMKTVHKIWLKGSFAKQKENGGGVESLGYLYPKELCSEIRGVNIDHMKPSIKSKLLLIDEEDHILNIPEKNKSFEKTVNKKFWLKKDNEVDKSLVPIFEIDTILRWIQKKTS